MSLKLWLPLMGDFHNQGLDGDINFTTSGTVNNAPNGKLGGTCKAFNTSCAIGNYDFTLGDEASLTLWMKPTAIPTGATTNWIVDLASDSGYGYSTFGFALRGTNIAVCCIAGDHNFNATHEMVVDKWYHIAVVWKRPYTYFYINGQLQYTYSGLDDGTVFTSSKLSFGANVVGTSSSRAKVSLNDFRLYDHALSVKEVHEISKGLIAHYPLNNLTYNAINDFVLTHKACLKPSGSVSAASSWSYSDYYPLKKGYKYCLKGLADNSTNTAFCLTYDKDKNIVNYYDCHINTDKYFIAG